MKMIHNGTRIIGIFPDTKQVHTPHTVFQGTRAEVIAEIVRLGLPSPAGYEDTPGGKQLMIFNTAMQTKPAAVTAFVKLLEPISALNIRGNETGDYNPAKVALEAVVTDTEDQASLKAELLACYPSD
jgi:hypothetical protein